MKRGARFLFGVARSSSLKLLLVLSFGSSASCEVGRDVVAVPVRSTAPSAGNTGLGGQTTSSTYMPYPSYAAQFGGGFGGASGSTSSAVGGMGGAGPTNDAGQSYGGAGAGAAGYPECTRSHPVVSVGSGSRVRTVCTATLARDYMSHALCACGDLEVPGTLATTAYDSLSGTSNPSGAAVGINGTYYDAAIEARIQGSFSVAGSSLLRFSGLEVSGDLKLNADVLSSGAIRVGRDAWFARSVSVLTQTSIARDLHLAPGASVTGLLDERVGGRIVRDFQTNAAPCRCGSDSAFDLASNIELARSENDNALAALSADALNRPEEAVDLELPCGTYFLTEVQSSQPIRMRVTGRAALFVAGSVGGRGEWTVELTEGAELDWFVGGVFAMERPVRVGDPNSASRLRILVAGASEIEFPSARLAANLYAPRANVRITGPRDVYGSIFARNIEVDGESGDLTVHYDRAILDLGDSCPTFSTESCSGCGECGGGLACIDADRDTQIEVGPDSAQLCTSCAADSDCCSPLVCDAGRCRALLVQ